MSKRKTEPERFRLAVWPESQEADANLAVPVIPTVSRGEADEKEPVMIPMENGVHGFHRIPWPASQRLMYRRDCYVDSEHAVYIEEGDYVTEKRRQGLVDVFIGKVSMLDAMNGLFCALDIHDYAVKKATQMSVHFMDQFDLKTVNLKTIEMEDTVSIEDARYYVTSIRTDGEDITVLAGNSDGERVKKNLTDLSCLDVITIYETLTDIFEGIDSDKYMVEADGTLVLSPGFTNPKICRSNETPLTDGEMELINETTGRFINVKNDEKNHRHIVEMYYEVNRPKAKALVDKLNTMTGGSPRWELLPADKSFIKD